MIVSSGKSECGKKKGTEGGFKNRIVLVGVVKTGNFLWEGYLNLDYCKRVTSSSTKHLEL